MRNLLETAKKNLEESCKGSEDICSIRFWAGYIKAIKDIDQKLKTEGIDKLEDA
jgi:hypothetical protein